MEEKSIIVKVTNRDNGNVGYYLPETGVKRTFARGETKNIPLSELKLLSYADGGEFILKELLIINDKSALKALNMEVEPEYYMNEDNIKKILETGTLDQLKDFIDFSPEGGVNLLKDIAVSMELPDVRKRNIIAKMTGFNVNTAIEINNMMKQPVEEPKEEKGRRVPVPDVQPAGRRRRTSAPAVEDNQE